jgi:hypothetical protein
MKKNNGNGKGNRPLFKIGDLVSFVYGNGTATGKVVEDRGCLGIGGRRLYGIRFEINPGDETYYIEVPEVELTRASKPAWTK